MRIGLPRAETLQGGSIKALILVSVRWMLLTNFVTWLTCLAVNAFYGCILNTLQHTSWLCFIVICVFCFQTVLLSAFMLQLLRTIGLRAFSMASETYTSGTHSAAFVTCPNDTVARDLARLFNYHYPSGFRQFQFYSLAGYFEMRCHIWLGLSYIRCYAKGLSPLRNKYCLSLSLAEDHLPAEKSNMQILRGIHVALNCNKVVVPVLATWPQNMFFAMHTSSVSDQSTLDCETMNNYHGLWSF